MVQKSSWLLEVQGSLLVFEPSLGVAAKECHHVAHCQFTGCRLALDCHVGELAFAFLKVDDSLFHGSLDDELVDFDIDGLVESMDTVDGLLFHELELKCR